MIPTKLFHYSKNPIEKLTKEFYEDNHYIERFVMGKPIGFWLSVEDFEDDQNWKTWCQDEEFYLTHLKHCYSVRLKPTAKILYLSTTEELNTFSNAYGSPIPGMPSCSSYFYQIDWSDIYDKYDGIIIAPYNWECRLQNPKTSWYYGWDCASGCIWNIDAIEGITLESVMDEAKLQEYQEAENEKDLRWANLVQSGLIVPLEDKA